MRVAKPLAVGTLGGVLLVTAVYATSVLSKAAETPWPDAVALTEIDSSDHGAVVEDWQVQRLDGSAADLADFEADYLFVNWWATWCAPCIAEMPQIETLARQFEGEDIAFLAVSDEDPDTVVPFVAEQGWQLPVYTAAESPSAMDVDVRPATFVLDRARRVVHTHIGIARWDDEAAVDLIENLLRSTAP